MSALTIDIALDAKNQVGESPIWDSKQQALYWTDIIGKTIHRFDPSTAGTQRWKTDDFPTAIALVEGQDTAILALAGGVSLFDFDGSMTPFANPDHRSGNRLNEGKCDPAGRFWVSSMQTNLNPDGTGREMTENSGALFRIDASGQCERCSEFDYGLTNTMAWSPDEKYFYFGDTLANILYRFDYDGESGQVSNRPTGFTHLLRCSTHVAWPSIDEVP